MKKIWIPLFAPLSIVPGFSTVAVPLYLEPEVREFAYPIVHIMDAADRIFWMTIVPAVAINLFAALAMRSNPRSATLYTTAAIFAALATGGFLLWIAGLRAEWGRCIKFLENCVAANNCPTFFSDVCISYVAWMTVHLLVGAVLFVAIGCSIAAGLKGMAPALAGPAPQNASGRGDT